MRIIGIVLLMSMLLGYAVLPMMKPQRSRLLGAEAPEFTLPVMHQGEAGSQLSLSDLKGKAVVLDFWASWCAPCRAQVPVLDRVARRFAGRGVVVVGVSTSGDDWRRAVEFAKSMNLSYPSVFDGDDAVGRAYHVRQLPTLVVVDRDGRIAAVRDRLVKEDDLEQLIEDALDRPGGESG